MRCCWFRILRESRGFATRLTASRGLGFTAQFILRVVISQLSGSKACTAHTSSIKHVLERTCLETRNKRGKQNHHPGVTKKEQANQQHRISIGIWKIPVSGVREWLTAVSYRYLENPVPRARRVSSQEGPGETRKAVGRLAGGEDKKTL